MSAHFISRYSFPPSLRSPFVNFFFFPFFWSDTRDLQTFHILLSPTIYLSPDFLIKIRGHVDNSDRVVFHKAIRTLIFRGDFSSFVTFKGTNASFPLRV